MCVCARALVESIEHILLYFSVRVFYMLQNHRCNYVSHLLLSVLFFCRINFFCNANFIRQRTYQMGVYSVVLFKCVALDQGLKVERKQSNKQMSIALVKYFNIP